jgi:hypothetical protein
MRVLLRAALAGVFVFFCACGSSKASDDGTSSSSSSGTIGGGTDAGGITTQNTGGCAAAAELVYVVSDTSDLYSFAPGTQTFKKVGTLNCPTDPTNQPNSMAIDRSGTAYINYKDGSLFKASTTDASCQATTFVPSQAGFKKFGMAFSTDGATSTSETLYISGLNDQSSDVGQGFGKVDLANYRITMLGDYTAPLSGRGAELTGTGDGKLYGFFATQPDATLAEIDETKGDTSGSKDLQGVATQESWAFSFYAGAFFFYTAAASKPSSLSQYAPGTGGGVQTLQADVGFRIVGAGVSTCAPITAPK